MYFTNRKDAGRRLAKKLGKYRGSDVVVYGIPRGGVVTAYEIATKIKAPLDLIISRKIGHPLSAEYAIAALSESGRIVGDSSELQRVNSIWLEQEIKIQHEEIERRRKLYLKNRKSLPVKGKIVMLVDDGIATGLTLEAAIGDIKDRHPKKIIVVVPVAPFNIAKKIEDEVDEFVVLATPKQLPAGIGAYYEDFQQVSDQEVIDLIRGYSS